MKAASFVAVTGLLLAATSALHAQTPSLADRLVSTWTLVSAEKNPGSDDTTRTRSARGMLVLDGAGYVFEFFSAPPARAQGAETQTGALQTLEEFGGFWGRYTVDESSKQLRFTAEAGVSPSVTGLQFTRTFELDGDRLVVTSGDEPQAQGHTRWVYQRFPTVENLSPVYREVAGFWLNVGERSVNTATGEITRESQRGPSVIVYTPAGFVGVHFPPRVREPFASATPTAEEAQGAMRGYIGYFGSLGVYPGEVSHNILSGISPTTGSILRRHADITGDDLIVRLQSGAARTSADERPRTATEVVLKRLSGAEDMLPR
jgi:hypothetical protein